MLGGEYGRNITLWHNEEWLFNFVAQKKKKNTPLMKYLNGCKKLSVKIR